MHKRVGPPLCEKEGLAIGASFDALGVAGTHRDFFAQLIAYAHK